ncbi:MAG: serine/threonine protein kinase [Gemmataceae bacterium]|nr:serine/threonine protein kinase [Gemmataceae bacterium]
MPQATLNDFAEKLCRSPILDALQREEAFRLSFSIANPRDFAQEMLRRDWITPYQANQLAAGKGDDLVLGQYVLLERLGEGGMGQVFKARQRNLNRIVALKLIRPSCMENERVVQRFMREIRAAGQLAHPHIVRAYDADFIKGHWFIAMEHIEGSDLAREVKQRGPLPVLAACDYVRQAALGLQHAHDRGLVHRDIKPANLLLTRHAEKPRISSPLIPRPSLGRDSKPALPAKHDAWPWGMIKILDLGLARLGESLTGSMGNLTQLNTVMGTPDFISPEQALNSKSCDIRSDLYSLGCTFYFMLTGQAPFPEGTLTHKLLQHQSEDPQPASLVRAARKTADAGDATAVHTDLYVPKEAEAVLRKLMAKKPEQRFQTPGQVAIVLEGLLETLQSGTATSRPSEAKTAATVMAKPVASPAPVEVEMQSASGIVPTPLPLPKAKPLKLKKPGRWRSRLMLAGVALTAILAAMLIIRGWKAARDRQRRSVPQDLRCDHASRQALVRVALCHPLHRLRPR